MDIAQIGGVSGITTAVIVIIYALYKVLHKSKCVTKCCGRETAGFAISMNEEGEGSPREEPLNSSEKPPK
jgi:hypothetical protein